MIGSELAYVRSQLKPLDRPAKMVVAKALGLSLKTMYRLASGETKFGRTDTIGKIAMYFRTKERRKQ